MTIHFAHPDLSSNSLRAACGRQARHHSELTAAVLHVNCQNCIQTRLYQSRLDVPHQTRRSDVDEPAEGPFDPLDAIREDMRELLYTLYDEFCTMDAYGVWEGDEQRREADDQIARLVSAYRTLDGDMVLWSHTKEAIARRYADV